MKTDGILMSSDNTPIGHFEMSVPLPPPLPSMATISYQDLAANETLIVHVPCLQVKTAAEEAKLLWASRKIFTPGDTIPTELALFELDYCLQQGPNCGLAALCIAATAVSRILNMDELYLEARYHGFTKQGEMFSADNMAFLANSTLNTWFNVELLAGGLVEHEQYLLESIRRGALLLVPYDADGNNSPCCKKGHKAHWAVICGFAKVNHGQPKVYVYARQGKSKHLSMWPFEQLAVSNSNLIEFHPKRAKNMDAYVLPEGGVEAGLSGKAVLLHCGRLPNYTDFNQL